MILVLSPSKTLDEKSWPLAEHTQPDMLDDSQLLVNALKKYTPAKLQALMDISEKLATLNVQRYKDFSLPFTRDNAKQALLMFKGDVYEGMDVAHYGKADFAFAQKHLRILSGLYGLLRPLDLMQPYRLEMGTRLASKRGKDLYQFWGARITDAINAAAAGHAHPVLINLASEEYFKAVQPGALAMPVINVIFKENQKGKLKIIGLFAKRARGLMADYIIKKRIENPKDIKKFSAEGYQFQPSLSNASDWVFTR
jgi:cytoplasmic iron level regulating protein YaaA (DUF328/UPF0246 family)